MAHVYAVGEAENDGERQALLELREGLSSDWHVVSNFYVESRGRPYECDALAIGPGGQAFLLEFKAWAGQIRGNDRQWMVPSLVGGPPWYPDNPANLTHRKAQFVKTWIKSREPMLAAVSIEALVVLVSETQPILEGSCASKTVVLKELVDRLISTASPRPDFPKDGSERLAAFITATTARVMPADRVGSWRLLELIETAPRWDIWRAAQAVAGHEGADYRLKRYFLDTLVTGDAAATQRDRARRDLDTLNRLQGASGAVPIVASAEELDGSFIVVTPWPRGDSLSSLVGSHDLDPNARTDVFTAFLRALASVHERGVIHRNLSLDCLHLSPEGQVTITDFDLARLPDVRGTITQDVSDNVSDFTAPEVRLDPASSTTRSDVWSAAQIGLELFGSQYDAPPEWSTALTQALSDEPADRPPDAAALLAALTTRSRPELFDDFNVFDELDDRYVVMEPPIRSGALAVILRVHDTVLLDDYAAKLPRLEYQDRLDPTREFQLLKNVEAHPVIARPQYVVQVKALRRSGRVITIAKTLLLTPWIEGTRLDKLIPERLPYARAVAIAADLLDGIAHLHESNLLHRDIKPDNVIVDEVGRPRLVDFNVSGIEVEVGRTETGTPAYRPPDVTLSGWDRSADIYGVCLVLSELLAGRRLSGDEARGWATQEGASNVPLSGLLLKGLAAHRENRFASASDVAAQLRAMVAVSIDTHVREPKTPPPSISGEEASRANWNPYQYRLLSLFSQSRTSNAGTRGLDDFAAWSYIPTALDQQLVPDLLSHRFRLVLITGNAGDGKTAFIQTFEALLRGTSGSSVQDSQRGNGVVGRLDGWEYHTNWDGSQDEGDLDNDDVLEQFLAPFAGAAPEPLTRETRLIAINEGRLLDFLATHHDQFRFLDEHVTNLSRGQPTPDVGWFTLVNLNLRVLTDTRQGRASVVQQTLERFSDERLWTACNGCEARDTCYARGNAAVLRDAVVGDRIASRIARTFDVARLRRRLHITMRDVRSALAFIVAGSHTCDEIVAMASAENETALLNGRIYNSVFAAGVQSTHPDRRRAEGDRLLALLGSLDVARTSDPELDARFWSLGTSALTVSTPEGDDRRIVEKIRDRYTDPPNQPDIRLVHGSLRRKHFFEREDPKWVEMLPYHQFAAFDQMLSAPSEEWRDRVISAITNSEGLFGSDFAHSLAVRPVGDGEGADRTYVTHDSGDFILSVVDQSAAARYAEYAPDRARLRHREHSATYVDVDLDLFEMLERMRAGFRPSREELRGSWLNLRVFKDQVAALPVHRLLLSRGDHQFFSLTRTADSEGVVVTSLHS